MQFSRVHKGLTMQAGLAAHLSVDKNNFVAAIDLGSNSFHILVAEFVNGRLRPVHCWGEKIQLAEGLEQYSILSIAAKQRAFGCLARFAEAIAEVPVSQVRVAGTDALRRAADSDEFIAQAEALLGVPVNVISGEQEARIIYRGVREGVKAKGSLASESTLIIDIGGGSTELVLGKGDEILNCVSLPMGCVSYSQRYFPNQCCDRDALEQSLRALKFDLAPIRDTCTAINWQQAIGTAGTALAIEAVLVAKGWTTVGISREGLEKLAELLCEGKSVAALQLPGLSEERFDIVTAGVVIMLAVFQTLGITTLETSEESLREGLIYSLLPELTL